MAHDGIMTGILIPEGGDPRRVELETLGRDSVDEALTRLVSGWFDTWPGVIPGVDLWVNDDGASKFGPNRAIYATGTRRASAGGESRTRYCTVRSSRSASIRTPAKASPLPTGRPGPSSNTSPRRRPPAADWLRA